MKEEDNKMKNNKVKVLGIAFLLFVMMTNVMWGTFSTVEELRTFVTGFAALTAAAYAIL